MDRIRLLNNSEMCRTCLKKKGKSTYLIKIDSLELGNEGFSIGQKLSECVPQLDMNLIRNAVVCTKCLSAINIAFNFKKMCLQTEQKILNSETSSKPTYKLASQVDFVIQNKQELDEIDIKYEPLADTSDGIIIDKEESNSVELQNKIVVEETALNIGNNLPVDANMEEDIEEHSAFICKECGECTSSEADLILHLNVHVEQPKEQVVAPYKCNLCKFNAESNCALAFHIKTHKKLKSIQRVGQIRYKCTKCNYVTTKLHALKAHVLKHTRQVSFKCPVCQREAVTKQELIDHICTHFGEKPFKCTLCSYKYSTLENLKMHSRIHRENHKTANSAITIELDD